MAFQNLCHFDKLSMWNFDVKSMANRRGCVHWVQHEWITTGNSPSLISIIHGRQPKWAFNLPKACSITILADDNQKPKNRLSRVLLPFAYSFIMNGRRGYAAVVDLGFDFTGCAMSQSREYKWNWWLGGGGGVAFWASEVNAFRAIGRLKPV